MRALALTLLIAGCTADREPTIDAVDPPYGPPIGGTRVAIELRGFTVAPTDDAQVLIGGRLAPLAAFVGADRLDVVTPPAAGAGPADVVVVIGDRAARAAGGFVYTTPPVIEGASPADVLYDLGGLVTIHGHGFLDEGAGPPTLIIGGITVTGVVDSDRELSVIAPPGRPLAEPTIELANTRGQAILEHAFRYLPSTRPGLLLFGRDGVFATFFDPVGGAVVPIPLVGGISGRLSSLVRDARGVYWGMNRTRRLGVVHLDEQRQDVGTFIGRRWPAMVRVGDDTIAVDREIQQLVRLDLVSGSFEPFGGLIPCCGSFGLAYDGSKLYLAVATPPPPLPDAIPAMNETRLYQIDPSTGELGGSVAIAGPPGMHLEELRFFDGVLYAGTLDGTFLTIDPATGETTQVQAPVGRVRAMEIFDSSSAP